MSKKLLSVVLALSLVLSVFAVGAFAIGGIGYESAEDAATYTQAWSLGEPVKNGDNYTVDVMLNANYGVGAIQFQVIKNVSAGTLTLESIAVNASVIPDNWLADAFVEDSTGEAVIIPNPSDDAVDAVNLTGGKVIATLTYAASADVAATLKINVADAKSATNPDGTLIAARMSDGNVVTGKALVGQTVSQDTNTVTIGASTSEGPTLVAKAGVGGVVDKTRTALAMVDDGSYTPIEGGCTGYIYGVDPVVGAEIGTPNTTIEEVFEISGDGSMEIVPSALASESGTGTMVNVKNTDGIVVETYCLIVFGDVNGDGAADGIDTGIMEAHDAYVYGIDLETGEDTLGLYGRMNPYQEFAADQDISGACDGVDAGTFEQHDAYVFGIDLETGEDTLGYGGRMPQSYVIDQLA